MSIALDSRLWFPDPRKAPRSGTLNGLVAMGGDFAVERLLLAYRSGIFPWSVNPITWWSPDPRGIFDLNQFHVSRSLKRIIRQQRFEITRDRAFREVMEGCAARGPGRPSTWISPEFVKAYTALHELGHAHSVECWQSAELAGGIYGVAIGGLFAGESMFHRVRDASKVALYYLIQHLRERGFALFDIQMVTLHTRQLGAIEVPRDEYLRRLWEAIDRSCTFGGET